jgi:uncharacterized damage-inducible protein DinB
VAGVGVEVFKHNLWANLRLLDACAALSEDDLQATAPGTYGKVRDTLVHLFASEGRYVEQFNDKRREFMLNEEQEFAGFEALRTHAVTSGEALITIAGRTNADRVLRGTYRDQPYVMLASILLVQAINHATEHRSHIISILSQRGVETPRLDGIGYFMAAQRG